MSLLLIAAALGEYSGWEATSKPRPSLEPGAPAVAGLRREAAVGAVRSTFMQPSLPSAFAQPVAREREITREPEILPLTRRLERCRRSCERNQNKRPLPFCRENRPCIFLAMISPVTTACRAAPS